MAAHQTDDYTRILVWEPATADACETNTAEVVLDLVTGLQADLAPLDPDTEIHDRFSVLADDGRAHHHRPSSPCQPPAPVHSKQIHSG